MSLPLLGIFSGGDKPFDAVDFNEESRKYFHVRVKNVIKTYDDAGKLKERSKYYDVEPCSSSSFKTEYE